MPPPDAISPPDTDDNPLPMFFRTESGVWLIPEEGQPQVMWFLALPLNYRPVNAQGIKLLPEDGIPPELWFQIPPDLP